MQIGNDKNTNDEIGEGEGEGEGDDFITEQNLR